MRACVSCGQEFHAKNPRKLACSPECTRERRRENETRCRHKRHDQPKEIPVEKVCGECRQLLPASAYHKNCWQPDGLCRVCKGCRAEYDRKPGQAEKTRERKNAWYILHHEEMRQKQNIRYACDPEFRARHNALTNARYHADPHRWIEARRVQRQAQMQWEAENARRCFCGRALPAESEDAPWFCRPRCKARCLRAICGAGERDETRQLIALLKRVRGLRDPQRLPEPEENLILAVARMTAACWHGRGSIVSNEDLLSAAYLGAWTSWLTYDSTKGAALKTWLIQGARREVLEALRAADPLSRTERARYREECCANPHAESPRSFLSLDALSEDAWDSETGEMPPGHPALCMEDEELTSLPERLDQAESFRRAMAVLPRGRDGEIVRRILDGESQGEVAERFGISPSRVHQVWAAAKERMREAVEEAR